MSVSVAVLVAISPALMVLTLPGVLLYRRWLMSAQLVTGARDRCRDGSSARADVAA
jgi:hypothetical protein